jgi:hypothetical protein
MGGRVQIPLVSERHSIFRRRRTHRINCIVLLLPIKISYQSYNDDLRYFDSLERQQWIVHALSILDSKKFQNIKNDMI